MRSEEQGGTAAKILFRPWGLIGSLLGGLLAGSVFKQVWKHATPGEKSDAPGALQSEYRMREIIPAAAVQGAIFAIVKALINRGGARVFQRIIGEWPGD
ncbi:DUF4235 domain-containing protein [soil metagenome]